MTLHLTMLTPDYILQVSDRRITRLDTGDINSLSNKNVVFLARDGIVTIGYTGLAYIEGVPTDTWIACKLGGEDHRRFRDGGETGMRLWAQPRHPWPDVGQAIELLTKETEAAFARLHPSQVMRHQIEIAGWQSHRKRVRPVYWVIENSEAELLAFTKDSAKRYEHYDRERDARLYAIPKDISSIAERAQFKLEETVRYPLACMRSLVEIVRYVASRNDGVGPDCMAILLPNPDMERKCYFTYEPLTEGRVAFVGDGPDGAVPAAFSPWFVGPELHAPPAIMIGGAFYVRLGDYELVGYAPPIPGGGLRWGKGDSRFVWGLFTQRRPRDPGSSI